MGNQYSDSIKKQPGLVYELLLYFRHAHRTICPAGYPGIRQPEDAVQRFL
jgi:hypothetical protein